MASREGVQELKLGCRACPASHGVDVVVYRRGDGRVGQLSATMR